MKYQCFIFHVSCSTIPKNIYRITNKPIHLFPSKERNRLYTGLNPSLGILVYFKENAKKKYSDIFIALKDIITLMVFLFDDYKLADWYLNIPERPDCFISSNLTAIVKQNKFTGNSSISDRQHFLFEKAFIQPLSSQINFLEIYQVYSQLKGGSKLKRYINFSAHNVLLKSASIKFYDNDDYMYSHYYFLFDALMSDAISEKMRNDSKLIRYIQSIPIENKLKKNTIDTFQYLRKLRDNFVHQIVHNIKNKSYNQDNKKKIIWEEDIEDNQARVFIRFFPSEFIKIILLTRLCNLNTKNAELFNQEFWDNSKFPNVVFLL